MAKKSAGILLFKVAHQQLHVLLVHPGGPFWKNKDPGAWSIPKGEFENDEDPLSAAIRELKEETGISLKTDRFIELDPVKLKSGKLVYAWAAEMDVDVTEIKSNEFSVEWPPKSGRLQNFPEVDRAEWFSAKEALVKINPSQALLIKQLASKISI